jgi:hypothetical protein
MALLACRVFEREIALYAGNAKHIRETRLYEVGLHDRPDELRATLQGELDLLNQRDDISAIALCYGLCGLGTAGLRVGRHPIVIPRAHDCITVLMGSKEAYSAHQRRCPTCYYYSPGWNRERRVPGPERLELLQTEFGKKYDADQVECLIEAEREQWAMHDRATFIDLDTADAGVEADYARRCAEWLGWKFERLRGHPKLLQDLLWGNWDNERFQIIQPGQQLAHAANNSIFRAKPAA